MSEPGEPSQEEKKWLSFAQSVSEDNWEWDAVDAAVKEIVDSKCDPNCVIGTAPAESASEGSGCPVLHYMTMQGLNIASLFLLGFVHVVHQATQNQFDAQRQNQQ